MTENKGDQELRKQFAALRREVDVSTPPFAAVASPQPGQTSIRWPQQRRWVPATLGVVSVLVVVLVLTSRVSDSEPGFDMGLASVAWAGPTDFLLATPGRDLLDAVPSVGGNVMLALPVNSENPLEGIER